MKDTLDSCWHTIQGYFIDEKSFPKYEDEGEDKPNCSIHSFIITILL